MAAFSIKVRGVSQLVRNLHVKRDELIRRSRNALLKSGFFLEGEIKQSIAGRRVELRSVDTGRFMQSVNTSRTGRDSVLVSSSVFYGPFLEYGTSKLPARSHFRNSVHRNRKAVLELFEKLMKS